MTSEPKVAAGAEASPPCGEGGGEIVGGGEVLHQGSLRKLGGRQKDKWEARQFVLTADGLSWGAKLSARPHACQISGIRVALPTTEWLFLQCEEPKSSQKSFPRNCDCLAFRTRC